MYSVVLLFVLYHKLRPRLLISMKTLGMNIDAGITLFKGL